ncbi:hypothetical protein RND71_026282 [Anisodus tanguticus]|uniref:Peroxidase n=1 Tax=Anisodus tanguticus TaxID=243964 RepID=A0AAE1RLY5_9SOLA|nr:hypothetical protein RND71_026282 [Anisodus tanguticus]
MLTHTTTFSCKNFSNQMGITKVDLPHLEKSNSRSYGGGSGCALKAGANCLQILNIKRKLKDFFTTANPCLILGCDASVLLNFTSSTGNQTEKVGIPNLTLRGFSFIDNVKKVIEAECPGVVSCADIVALVARDSVMITGGPFWNVPTGRRDGRISNASETLSDIPAPTSAHTIGVSHCSSFSTRLYNFTGTFGTQDPSLDSEYAANLKAKKCKSINDNTTIVEMDPGSFRTFDLSYYKLLLKRRGLFQSDAALTTSTATKSYINQLVEGSLKEFYAEFAQSMEKMGRIEVKTGTAGEIRKHCAVVNS